MNKTDTYQTIAAVATGEYKEKGSRFVAYAYPITDETDLKNCLDALRTEHPKARHHCYAYRLDADAQRYRINDDGEPSGTAGRPIIGQIDSAGLTHVLVVVVRYFGGTKLGVSGLITAYKAAAHAALAAAEIVTKRVETIIVFDCNYANLPTVRSVLKRQNTTIYTQVFDAENTTIQVVVAVDDAAELRAALTDLVVFGD